MSGHAFSFRRFWAVVVKEFIQMRRDRMTFGMMVGIPLLQLMLFAATSYGSVLAAKSLIEAGTSYWSSLMQFLIFLGVIFWAFRTQSKAKQAENIESLTSGDYATKSYNQRYIMECLAREKGKTDRSNLPFSICIFDIERFSEITETYGAAAGERVLKQFFRCVRQELRAMDSVNPTGIERAFGRYSHQEFVAVLPNTARAGAFSCAERIIARAIGEQYEHGQDICMSAGVAEYRRSEKLSELLSRAERALNKAIQVGHNQVQPRGADTPQSAEIIEWRGRS